MQTHTEAPPPDTAGHTKARSIDEIIRICERAAEGDLEARLVGFEHDPEWRLLARAINRMLLQFGPHLLMLPLTGYAADHLDRRKLLLATQASMGALALALGLLTIAGMVQLWQVYLIAFLLGCVSAFDSPARQTFAGELVGEEDLSNAVALNSTSFNAARMLGPAAAGVLIAAVGSGWVFLINAASFGAVLASLGLLRTGELHVKSRAQRAPGGFADGFRYVWKRPDLKAVLLMVFLIGTFGLNFQIFISTMAVTAFHAGAGRYGLLTSTMALGSVTGALLAARRARPRLALREDRAFWNGQSAASVCRSRRATGGASAGLERKAYPAGRTAGRQDRDDEGLGSERSREGISRRQGSRYRVRDRAGLVWRLGFDRARLPGGSPGEGLRRFCEDRPGSRGAYRTKETSA